MAARSSDTKGSGTAKLLCAARMLSEFPMASPARQASYHNFSKTLLFVAVYFIFFS